MEVNGDFCAPTPMEEALNWRLSSAQSSLNAWRIWKSLAPDGN